MRHVTLGIGLVAITITLVWLWPSRNPSAARAGPASTERAPGSLSPAQGVMADQTSTPRPSPPAVLPLAVQRALEDPSWRPKPGEVLPLPPAAEAVLIEHYRAIPILTNKLGITLALAYGGSETVVPLLANAITNEFTGRVLSPQEADIFAGLLHLMGYVAQRHRAAYEFLEAACAPSFWSNRPLPQSPELAKSGIKLEDSLLQYTLIGLAFSGRPEALVFFEGIQARAPEQWREHRSSVVDAVFRYRMLEKYGEAYSGGKALSDFDSFMNAFREWRATPEGAAWAAWSHPESGQRPFRRQ